MKLIIDRKRESRIAAIFLKHGVEVEFVDEIQPGEER